MMHRFKYSGAFILLVSSIFVFGTVGCSKSVDTQKDTGRNIGQDASASMNATNTPTAQVDRIVVYYFHNTRRCATCMGIQEGIEDTINAHFQKDIEAGMLEFRELNMEDEENSKYVAQFKLSFSTMIVAAEASGDTRKWENAGKVWDFAHSPDELKSYVAKIIRQHLDLIGRAV